MYQMDNVLREHLHKCDYPLKNICLKQQDTIRKLPFCFSVKPTWSLPLVPPLTSM